MENTHFLFNKTALHYEYYSGDNPKVILLLIHGLGEHLGRYEAWAQSLQQYNYGICGFDLPGHGKSTGKRGHFPPLDVIFDMLDCFLDRVKAAFPNLPIILYGHSMGGNIAANYTIHRQPAINALILSSPWLELANNPSTFKMLLAKIMYRIYPAFGNDSALNISAISSVPEEIEKYKKDPLIHSRISPSLFLPLFHAGYKAIDKASKINVPLYLFHGKKDRLTSPYGSEKMAQNHPNATLKLYHEGFHELHHDKDRQQVLEDLLDWLAANVLYRL